MEIDDEGIARAVAALKQGVQERDAAVARLDAMLAAEEDAVIMTTVLPDEDPVEWFGADDEDGWLEGARDGTLKCVRFDLVAGDTSLVGITEWVDGAPEDGEYPTASELGLALRRDTVFDFVEALEDHQQQ